MIIQQVADIFQQFTLSLGEEETKDFISNLVFSISIGSNDYIHYYLRNVSNVQSLYLPWKFYQLLAATVKQELKVLRWNFILFFSFNLMSVYNDHASCAELVQC